MRHPMDQCARCWARNGRPCEVCNYPLPRKEEETLPAWATSTEDPMAPLFRRPPPAWDLARTGRTRSDTPNLANVRREAVPCTCLGDTFDPGCRYHREGLKEWSPVEHKATSREALEAWESRRMRSASLRAGHYPADMTKRERLARRLIDSAITPAALVHYMGVYAGAIP